MFPYIINVNVSINVNDIREHFNTCWILRNNQITDKLSTQIEDTWTKNTLLLMESGRWHDNSNILYTTDKNKGGC